MLRLTYEVTVKICKRSRACALIGLLVVVCGSLLRVSAASGELWLDEQWSLLLVQKASSPVELITTVRHDNNHLLNSLWMWVVGAYADPFLYRLPAVICGCAMLIIATGLVRRNEMGPAGLVWCVFLATSYPLILVGTEARGYSVEVLAAVASFGLALELSRAEPKKGSAALFLACSVLGLLSHATFMLFLVPTLVWLAWRRMKVVDNLARDSATWIIVVVPSLVSFLLWRSFYGILEVGGGPEASYLQVFISTISTMLGGSELSAFDVGGSAYAFVLAGVALLFASVEAIAWMRSGDPASWLVLGIIVAPVCAVLVGQPPFLLPRYFILAAVFSYLLLARLVARLFAQNLIGKCLAAALVLGFVTQSGQRTIELVTRGRSHYQSALEALASAGQPLVVGGDLDNQNELRWEFLRLRRAPMSTLSYVRNAESIDPPPAILLREWIEPCVQAPSEYETSRGIKYSLIEWYPAPLLSGFSLGVYARVP